MTDSTYVGAVLCTIVIAGSFYLGCHSTVSADYNPSYIADVLVLSLIWFVLIYLVIFVVGSILWVAGHILTIMTEWGYEIVIFPFSWLS